MQEFQRNEPDGRADLVVFRTQLQPGGGYLDLPRFVVEYKAACDPASADEEFSASCFKAEQQMDHCFRFINTIPRWQGNNLYGATVVGQAAKFWVRRQGQTSSEALTIPAIPANNEAQETVYGYLRLWDNVQARKVERALEFICQQVF